jgi:tRNA-dihydrouridine synthase B
LHRSYGEEIGVRVARKHIGWYLEGRPGAEEARHRLMRCERSAEQFDLLRSYFDKAFDKAHGTVCKTGAADQGGRLAA